MTAAAKSARAAVGRASARLASRRRSADDEERARTDAQLALAASDIRVLDALLVLLGADESPAVTPDAAAADEVRQLAAALDRALEYELSTPSDTATLIGVLEQGRRIARILGPLFA